jgi:hypothetical protein
MVAMKMCDTSEPTGTRPLADRLPPSPEGEAMAEQESFALPQDLTEWLGAALVMEWVEEEVERLEWNQPGVQAYLKQHPDYCPKMMLSLLGYAYATHVLGSEDIVTRCYSDTTFRLLSRGNAPTATEVMRFRRENRGLLRGILYGVFVRALKEHYGSDALLLPPGLKRLLLDSATERLDVARHMDSLEE